ncbi:patatin-like phospholipase family protein [Cohaesibacter sp. ES.047]|uniref:patatin-like phospholipase family protein n=1 Tax=Cohaesibacter sp. ES.047 TaxID=1798205 RepID=UPI000BB75422|nr:patatin-like phospholipase family protein [Cohaesibacter sp. ES.047]
MSEKTVGIAFGGGGARGLAHIWIMEALDELGIKPFALSGCSIGALAAACYGSGMSGADLRTYVVDLFGNRGEVLSRLWQNRPKSFSELFATPGHIGNWAQFDPEWLAEAFLPPEIKPDFADFSIPVTMSATNYFSGEEVIMREGSVMKAMAASMAIPALFRPVLIGDEVLIDGGCVNPMPVDHLRGAVDIIIAIDVVGLPQKPADGKVGSFEMGFGATQILMQTIQREKMRHDKVDILVQPLIASFRPLDFLKAADILASSEASKDEVKRSLSLLMES